MGAYITKDNLEMINTMDGVKLLIIWVNFVQDYMKDMAYILMIIFITKAFSKMHNQVDKASALKDNTWLSSIQQKISMTS